MKKLLLVCVLCVLMVVGFRGHERNRLSHSVRDTLVHYVLPSGQDCPALVVNVVDPQTGLVNLTVFPDWSNDSESKGIVWQTNVHFDQKQHLAGTWHRIEGEK